MRATISDGCTWRMAASFTTVLMVGLLSPRSSRLTKVRSNPASNASRSWEMPFSSRIARSAWPNAFSGPDSGWTCFLPVLLVFACAKQTMLICCGP